MKVCSSCWGELTNDNYTVCSECGNSMHLSCTIDGTHCDSCHAKKGKVVRKKIDFEVPEFIRRSYIQTYKECPHKFYKEVIQGVENITGSHAQIGIDFHDLAEKASRGLYDYKEQMIEEFTERFNLYKDSMFEGDLHLYKDMSVEGLKKKLYKVGIDSIDVLFYTIKTLPKEAYALEQNIQFIISEDLPRVSITMDRVDMINGELEVIDWKTGTVMVGQNLSSDLQAPLYILAVKKEFGLPVRKFTFKYLGENKERVFTRVSEEEYECYVGKRKYVINLTETLKEVQKIFGQIIKGNFNIPLDTKKMYFTCKTCSVRKQGLCEGADVQVWRQSNSNQTKGE